MSRYQSVTGAHWFPVTPTLSEWRGGHWEVLGSKDLELDASIYRLEADGEVQLSVANLEESAFVSVFVFHRPERAS